MKIYSRINTSVLLALISIMLVLITDVSAQQNCTDTDYSTSPMDSASNVDPNTDITIEDLTYQIPPCESNWDGVEIEVRETQTNNSGPGHSQTSSDDKATFSPNNPLNYNTEYRALFYCNDFGSISPICYIEFTTAENAGPQPPPPPSGPTEDVRLKVKIEPPGSGMVEGSVISPSVANDPIDCPDDCTGEYPKGTAVRLTAKPEAGQQLLRWTTSSNVNITERNGNRADARLDGDGEITAIFGPGSDNMPPTDCSVEINGNTISGGCRDPEDDPVETRLEVYPENNPCQPANPLYSQYRASGNTISQQISALAEGVRYCTRVCGTDAGSNQEVCSEPQCFNAGSNRNVTTLVLPPGREQSQYKMISMPVHLANASSVAFFGLPESATPGQIKFGTYNTASRSYISHKPTLKIVPGRGYWYLSKIPFNGAAFGVPAATGVDSDVPIQTGWNQIGPPNARKYLWEDVLVLVYADNCALQFGPVRIGDLPEDNPFIDKRLFAWKNGQYYLVDTLNAYEGYWIRAKQNVTLRFLSSAGTAAAKDETAGAKETSSGSCFINTLAK